MKKILTVVIILAFGFTTRVYAAPTDVRAVYLGINNIYNPVKISYLENLLATRDLNAIVIDFKVGKPELTDHMRQLIKRFQDKNVYVICRQVVFQDSYLAKTRPDLALRLRNAEGGLWYSGRQSWQRYWVDMASPEVLPYNIEIAKQGLDMGCEEINFDYIRFPTDGPTEIINVEVKGKTEKKRVPVPIYYPAWNSKTSPRDTLESFFAGLKKELKAHRPNALLSIDVFGKVYQLGYEPSVAQDLLVIAKYFDVVAPMAYPSHYGCYEFKADINSMRKELYVDPNTIPERVYDETLAAGNKILEKAGVKTILRPWIQDFSIPTIYGCGPRVDYGPIEVRAQIRPSRRHGASGFMLWNPGNDYTKEAHDLRK